MYSTFNETLRILTSNSVTRPTPIIYYFYSSTTTAVAAFYRYTYIYIVGRVIIINTISVCFLIRQRYFYMINGIFVVNEKRLNSTV